VRREEAEKIITEYLGSIFGFALKRCKNAQDAEDLSQDIVLKAFHALLIKDDIGDVSKFIWTIAHNALSNYYRDAAKSVIGVSIDEVAEIIADPDSMLADDDNADTIRRLQSEIAYLSKLQRKIVIAYYFENRKPILRRI
jgi:RNA polymerase sigma factor (sigma-70 family)